MRVQCIVEKIFETPNNPLVPTIRRCHRYRHTLISSQCSSSGRDFSHVRNEVTVSIGGRACTAPSMTIVSDAAPKNKPRRRRS